MQVSPQSLRTHPSGLGNAPRICCEDNEGLRQVSKVESSKSIQHHPKSEKVNGLGKDHTRNAHHRDTVSLLCITPLHEAPVEYQVMLL